MKKLELDISDVRAVANNRWWTPKRWWLLLGGMVASVVLAIGTDYIFGVELWGLLWVLPFLVLAVRMLRSNTRYAQDFVDAWLRQRIEEDLK